MLLKRFGPITYFLPEDGAGIGDDFMTGALSELGEFDSTDGTTKPDEDLDVKPDDSKDDDLDDVDDIDEDDKPSREAKPIKDAVVDEKEEKEEEDKEKEEDKKPIEIEAKDLTPKALKESYPKIFKEFPELKDVIFQNREYNRIFGSVEDATEAKEKASIFDDIAETTLAGNPIELMNALEKTERGRLEDFTKNMITEIRKTNPDMYYRVTDPVIASALKAAETHATKSGDKNLLLATKYLATFVFGDQEIPAFNAKKEVDPERVQFERQKAQEAEQRYSEHQKTIYDYTERKLDSMIREGLDPDNVYNNFVREALADKVMTRIGQTLRADRAFQGQMTALWKKAHKEGFTREAKQRIAHTYLAKAKRIMPAIRSKIRGEAPASGGSGSNGSGDNKEKKVVTSGGNSGNTGKKAISNDPNKINWSKVTDEDILASP